MRNCGVDQSQQLSLCVHQIKHDLSWNIDYLEDLVFFWFLVSLPFNLNVQELLLGVFKWALFWNLVALLLFRLLSILDFFIVIRFNQEGEDFVLNLVIVEIKYVF